jgi:AmmeMemoRadiSam system protein A
MSGRSLPADACGVAISPAMKKRMGAFVTLKIDGDLRGCVGEIFPTRPLCDAVAERAVDAALRDSRFPRLRPADLGKVEIEISALTPPRKLGSYKEIKLGRDGVVLNVDGSGAVFLPQVAPEQGWSLEEMLTHLCIKANVPQRAWGDADAKFSVFEAVVFNEGQFPKD